MPQKADDIVLGLNFLADRADQVGAPELGAYVRDAISKFESGAPLPEGLTVPPVTDNTGVVDNAQPPIDTDVNIAEQDYGYDELDKLEQEIDEARFAEALPDTFMLILSPAVGAHPLTRDQASDAVALVLPTVNSLIGDEDDTFNVGEGTQHDTSWHVPLQTDSLYLREALLALGIGMDAFNANVLVGGVEVAVTSEVGQPVNPEAAAQFGIRERELEEPSAGHQVNVAVDRAEAVLGARPRAASLEVTYRRTDGAELDEEMVETILSHPVTQHGLRRFGDLTRVSINGSEDLTSKTVVFIAGEAGDIDPAALSSRVAALGGIAASYGGHYPFDGLGVIECSSSVELADIAYPAFADENDDE